MKVLFVDDDINILELLTVFIESTYESAEVASCVGPQDAINELQSQKFDLIICDFEMGPQGNGDIVYRYLVEKNISTPFLLFTSRDRDETDYSEQSFPSDQFKYLQKPASAKNMRNIVLEMLPEDNKELRSGEEYSPIRIYHFYRFSKTRCSVFVKINDEKFVRLFNENQEYNDYTIDKYVERGVEHLYIKTTDFENFYAHLGELSFLTHTVSKEDGIMHRLRKTHKILRLMIAPLGISQHTLQLANSSSEQIINQVRKIPNLGQLVEELIASNDYSYDHTFLTTVFSIKISKYMGLDQAQISKLSLAALLHDISIRSTRLTYLHDLHPEEINRLEKEEKNTLKNHQMIMTQFDKLDSIFSDINKIIQLHHSCDQRYPFRTNTKMSAIPPLPAIFIVAHELTVMLYRHNFNLSTFPDIISNLHFQFETENFRKPLEALEEYFRKIKKAA